jgi:hypothetical protein
VTKHNRLERLEATVGRAALENIPDAEVGAYCNACLGPGAYRRRLDAARARLFAAGWNGRPNGGPWDGETMEEMRARHARWAREEEEAAAAFVCRGCGGETMEAAIARIRREAGLA